MSDLDQLHEICQKTHQEQAIWFLNSFWETHEKEAELLWQYVIKCAELDDQKHEEGNGLDEMKAHVFLEAFQETLTVREMRAKLRSTGAIGEKERPKAVPITHYLLFKYGVDWHTLVDPTRQGSNKEELAEAERRLAEVMAAFQESEKKASEARVAHNEAIARENEAKARDEEAKASEAAAKKQEAEAHADAEAAKASEAKAHADADAAAAREAESKAAQAELEAALAEVKAQEDAYNNKTEELKRKSEEGGVVSRNRAKNELAQHLGEDPLPLRRAKITAEAAVKKADKATKASAAARSAAEASAAAASEAREAAEESARAATGAREAAEADARAAAEARAQAEAAAAAAAEAKAAAEQALDAAAAALKDAEVYIEEVKSKPGQAFGALWWIDRQLHEQRKYLPESKGGIRK